MVGRIDDLMMPWYCQCGKTCRMELSPEGSMRTEMVILIDEGRQ